MFQQLQAPSSLGQSLVHVTVASIRDPAGRPQDVQEGM